ncbi:ABC transporter permease [Alkaliphilus hydrothermalis]|uniref:ABC transporter permease n=1 Tax=Alkaliphilus hydrothermalis TaxID=1482730 RepID=A0ABS2NSE3_9FIRM|nr:ABC transporter permease [Alkaliphilus hydrothermalis]MBM7615489.1 hypothetical protein [Alkaliphilus hydrothermalis]
MKGFIGLKILDRFKFLFTKLDVDYRIMRKILQLKLVMDERRVPTFMMNDHPKEGSNAFRNSLMLYAFMGALFAMFIFPPFPLFYKMNMILGVILFIVTTAMIGDYSSVLLDVKEKNILLPKPIDVKTINAAKVLHVLIYLFSIILAIATPTLLVGSFKYGVGFAVVLIVQLVFMAGFIIFSTSILYFALLHFFDGEKLKDIINYFQILMTVAMIILYQLVGRVFEIFNFDVVYTPKWWNYLLPSVWFSAPFSIFVENQVGMHYVYFSILGFVIPIMMLFLYFKAVAPYFEGLLQKLNISSGKTGGVGKKQWREGIGSRIAGKLLGESMDGVFYRFTLNMVASERTLKLKLYPTLAFAIILPFIFVFSSLSSAGSVTGGYRQLKEGNFYLYLYFTISMLANTIPMLSTSEGNKAAWIYHILPIENPNVIYRGALKAFIGKYILPVYGAACIIFLGVYGLRILPDIFLMMLNLLLLIIIIFHYSKKPLPFSQDFQYIKHNNMSIMLQLFAFSGVSAGIHWFLISRGYNILVYAGVVLAMVIITWKKVFSTKVVDIRTEIREENGDKKDKKDKIDKEETTESENIDKAKEKLE